MRIIKNGHLSEYALTNIYQEVNDFGDRGLLGIALDPDFTTNHYLYLLYTYENDVNNYDGFKTSRLSRFTVGTTGDPDYADPATEKVLLGTTVGTLVGGSPYGKPAGTPMTGSCDDFKPGTDCLPSDDNSHSIGSIAFAPDKTMYVSVGDGASYDFVDDKALRAQDLTSFAGKLLHIDRNGKGFSGNPFYTGRVSDNKSKVWAYGLRNPFRFTLKPGTSVPFIGNVGWSTWEEIVAGPPGADYGWPCYEGNYKQPGYQDKGTCTELCGLGTGKVTFGLVSWNHNNASSAVIGGAFYTGTAFPPQYQGALFFGDYGQSVIRTLTVHDDNTLATGPTDFYTSADGPTQFMMGPNNDMYYVAINAGEVRRIFYETNVPVAVAVATPNSGATAPLTVRFSSAGSSNPNGDPPRFSWDFGDGAAPVTDANPTHTYTATGTFTVTLTVFDNAGNERQTQTTVTVGAAPVVTITSPKAGDSYVIGSTSGTGYDLIYSGSAQEADGTPISADNLSWKVILHHCQGTSCHVHYLVTNNGTDHGTFTPPQHEDNSYTEVVLTAKSRTGVEGSQSLTLQPQKVPITITTNPPGLPIVYGGTAYMAPYMVNAIVGGQRTIEAPSSQDYTFLAWSDGGTSQHDIYVNLDHDQNGQPIHTYTATYKAVPPAITGITPNTGVAAGGASVTITGSHLATGGTPVVKFDGTAATNVSVTGGAALTVTAPPHAPAPVTVSVTTAGGTATTTFTYSANPAPTITTVSPNVGGTSGGTIITITGKNFVRTGTTAVAFGSTAGTNVRVVNDTTITVTTPAHGAGQVDVDVTTGGQSVVVAKAFTYAAPPTIPPTHPGGRIVPEVPNATPAPQPSAPPDLIATPDPAPAPH